MQRTNVVRTIDPRELQKLIETDGVVNLIDVRTPAEFRALHAEFARNVPLDEIDPVAIKRDPQIDSGPLYFICHSEARGRKACEALLAAGHTNVINVSGGTVAWRELGLPVVRGTKMISLERQVRIAAGLLVLIGAFLGFFISPAWIGLCAFAGAGLVFAGVSDTCAMASLLAKMPWNTAKLD